MARKQAGNDKLAAFERYMRDAGVEKPRHVEQDGKFHYQGMRGNESVNVTFDPGTIIDGTYNVFLSDAKHDSEWQGVLEPGQKGEYTLSKKGLPAQLPAQLTEGPKLPEPKAGKYSMHIVRDEADAAKPKQETGRIVIADGDGKIVADCEYISGPWGKGFAPHVERYDLKRDIEKFTTMGKKPRQLEGLRISDDSFKGLAEKRGGILIHPDDGTVGTEGCFGIKEAQWGQFKDAWNAIPARERPCEMCPMKPAGYEAMKKKNAMVGSLDAVPEALVAAVSKYLESAPVSSGRAPFKPVIPGVREV